MSATAHLTWNPASGAVDYKVEYKLQSSGSYTLFNGHVSGTSSDITGLAEGTAYDFRVTTNCAAASASGVVISGNTDCVDVSGLSASFSGTTANLEWDKKTDAASYKIEYKLQSSGSYTTASGSPLTNVGQPDPVLFAITGLTPGAAYDFRVTVNCNVGTSSGEVTSATSTCPNVTSLAVTFS